MSRRTGKPCRGGAWGAPERCLAHDGLEIGKDGRCAEGRRAPCFGGWGVVGDTRCSVHKGAKILHNLGRCADCQQQILIDANAQMRPRLATMVATLSDAERAVFAEAQMTPTVMQVRWKSNKDGQYNADADAVRRDLASSSGFSAWVEILFSVSGSWRHGFIYPRTSKHVAGAITIELVAPATEPDGIPTVQLAFASTIGQFRRAP